MKQTSIYMGDELKKRLRIRAIEEDTSASKIIERLVTEYLSSKKGKGGSS